MDEFRCQVSRAARYDYPTRLVDPDEIATMCPIANTDKVLGGLHTPFDGYVDPYSLTMTLAGEARRFGAKLYTHTKVTGLAPAGRSGWNVQTDRGLIKCQHVVNAAGFWAQDVCRLVGSLPELPMVTVHHQYVITETLPELEKLDFEIPVMRDMDGSYYLRQVSGENTLNAW